MKKIPRRVWLEISRDVLTSNFNAVSNKVSPCEVMPVLKANSYGLGVLPIAETLKEAGAMRFGVAEPYEALQLLPLERSIHILSSILPEEVEPMIEAGITIPVASLESAQLINRTAEKLHKFATVHFKVDTGMGRLGILYNDAYETISKAHGLPGLISEGIFSHFSMAYERTSPVTLEQINKFKTLLMQLSKAGKHFKYVHIANSDAINNFPESYHPPFNMVRTGINLHGAFDAEGNRSIPIQPAISLKTRLTAVRKLPAGSCIGYGHTYKLKEKTRIGTISAGYADGLPLSLSNQGNVIIRDRLCPIIGRVSMDYTNVSLKDAPEAQVGDDVTCLGATESNCITIESWAELKNTHPYEIICSFGNRVERRYI
ncbi:MAG: alanine racemase [Kiritimatiellae bacterium]|jgi:alanine racemase|nr:alanine racemase [Kiritimatiellia bacterium]